jgi:hypothetical protein
MLGHCTSGKRDRSVHSFVEDRLFQFEIIFVCVSARDVCFRTRDMKRNRMSSVFQTVPSRRSAAERIHRREKSIHHNKTLRTASKIYIIEDALGLPSKRNKDLALATPVQVTKVFVHSNEPQELTWKNVGRELEGTYGSIQNFSSR